MTEVHLPQPGVAAVGWQARCAQSRICKHWHTRDQPLHAARACFDHVTTHSIVSQYETSMLQCSLDRESNPIHCVIPPRPLRRNSATTACHQQPCAANARGTFRQLASHQYRLTLSINRDSPCQHVHVEAHRRRRAAALCLRPASWLSTAGLCACAAAALWGTLPSGLRRRWRACMPNFQYQSCMSQLPPKGSLPLPALLLLPPALLRPSSIWYASLSA